MNLFELDKKIKKAVDYAVECGESLKDIPVTVEISNLEGLSISSDEVDIHYDNNVHVSGCVIVGDIE